MRINTTTGKSLLALCIASMGVLWLTLWHQYMYSRSEVVFPPFSTWWRDAIILMPGVAIAIWLGFSVSHRLIEHHQTHMSASTRVILTAGLLGLFTSLAAILTESVRMLQTGIGSQLTFLSNICRTIYPAGNILLTLSQKLFSGPSAFRFHIMLQDGIHLALINVTMVIVFIMVAEISVQQVEQFSQPSISPRG